MNSFISEVPIKPGSVSQGKVNTFVQGKCRWHLCSAFVEDTYRGSTTDQTKLLMLADTEIPKCGPIMGKRFQRITESPELEVIPKDFWVLCMLHVFVAL